MSKPANESRTGLSTEEFDEVWRIIHKIDLLDRAEELARTAPGMLVACHSKHGMFLARWYEFEDAYEIFNETKTWRIVWSMSHEFLTGDGDEIREWAMLVKLKSK